MCSTRLLNSIFMLYQLYRMFLEFFFQFFTCITICPVYLDNRNSGDICVSKTAIWTQNNSRERAFLSSFYEINNVCGNIKTVYQNVEHQVQWHPEYYGTHHISCMLIVSYKLLVTLLNFNVNAVSGWKYVKPKFNFLPNFGGILWSVFCIDLHDPHPGLLQYHQQKKGHKHCPWQTPRR